MPYVARRTIAELATLYHLEPDIRDVVVEGPDDASVIRWYLHHRGGRSASVTEIAAIDVPPALVEKCNVEMGNRGRVLALAEELNTTLRGNARKCPTLVVDADTDHVFGHTRPIDMLLSTDFACLEMYLFNKTTVHKMMSLVLMSCHVSTDHALNALSRVLVRLWIIKTANHLLGLAMTWIAFEGCCQLSGTSIEFAETEFVRRYLMNNSRLEERESFDKQMREVESQLREDSRFQMNGHHFFTLARWYFRKFAKEKRVVSDGKAFERAFFGCLELTALDTYPMFQRLASRIAD